MATKTCLQNLGLIEEDDELVLLSLCANSSNSGERTFLEIDKLTDETFKVYFRFEKGDIFRLYRSLGLPEKIPTSNRTCVSGLEALCILLKRLAYPNRLEDLITIFNRPTYELSYIIKAVLDTLYETHKHRLSDFNKTWLDEHHLREFAAAISDLGAPLPYCWGFIDGTIRPICRPQHNQRIVYSGHKRLHGLKFQSVVAPNGLIANLYGPIEGRRHDAAMLRYSGILPELEQNMTLNDGTIFSLYGDPAYPLLPHIITPFRGAVITNQERIFNKRMSKLRTSAEWTFGKIRSIFAFLDYKKNNKLYLQPVGKYYAVAAILTNCHTCLYGSTTTTYFGVNPPSLEEYMAWTHITESSFM